MTPRGKRKLSIKQTLAIKPPKQELNRTLEMTRRLSDSDALNINIKLKHLKNAAQLIEELLDALENPNWQNNSVLTHINMPYIALLAYQEGYLLQEQFSTLLIVWSAWKLHGQPLQPVTLLDETGEANQRFFELLTTNLAIPSLKKQLQLQHLNIPQKAALSYYLSTEQLKTFLIQATSLPKSEQVFFTVPKTIDMLQTILANNTSTRIIDIINGPDVSFSALGRIIENDSLFSLKSKVMNIIPSFSLMQLYLKIKFGEQAVRINPVLGLSSVADIRRNGLFNERDMALHFPGVEMPTDADYFVAEWYDFTYHDFYHSFVASAIPSTDRILMVLLYDTTKALLAERNYGRAMALAALNWLPEEAKTLISEYSRGDEDRSLAVIADNFIDMEHPFYRANYSIAASGKKETSALLFLMSLIESLSQPVVLNVNREMRNHNKYATYIELSQKTANELFETIIRCILTYGEKNIADFITNNYDELLAIYNAPNPLLDLITKMEKNHPLTMTRTAQQKNAEGFGKSWRNLYTSSPALFNQQPETKLALQEAEENSRKFKT